FSFFRADRKRAIINGPWTFINVNENVRRTANPKGSGFAKGGVLRIGFVFNAGKPRAGYGDIGHAVVTAPFQPRLVTGTHGRAARNTADHWNILDRTIDCGTADTWIGRAL